jgi:hypothetical protein
MHDEFPTPHTLERRKGEWPPFHDVGVYLSVGDSMMLVGTARDSGDLTVLFHHLAVEWGRILDEPADWFFTDLVR